METFITLLSYSHFRQNFFWTFTGKIDRVVKLAFIFSNETCWRKNSWFKKGFKFSSISVFEQKTSGRVFKPVLELYRATFRTKYCFLQETLFYLQLRLRVKKIYWVRKLAFLLSRGTSWSETSFWNRKQFSLFFYFARKTFDRTENRIPFVQGNILK